MYIIYNLLMIGAFFLVMPYFIYRSICEKGFTRRMRQSLGGIRDEEIEAVALKGCIWIHGASVGEIVATSPFGKGNPQGNAGNSDSGFGSYGWRL